MENKVSSGKTESQLCMFSVNCRQSLKTSRDFPAVCSEMSAGVAPCLTPFPTHPKTFIRPSAASFEVASSQSTWGEQVPPNIPYSLMLSPISWTFVQNVLILP